MKRDNRILSAQAYWLHPAPLHKLRHLPTQTQRRHRHQEVQTSDN